MESVTTAPVSTLQNYATVDPKFKINERGTNGSLSQDDFFKLLTVQLTSQDPLKPMEDTEFISQMTSFSSLSEMEGMAANMKMMREQQEVFTTQSLIGKYVQAEGPSGELIEGIVDRVVREDGVLVPYIGDQLIASSRIKEISEVWGEPIVEESSPGEPVTEESNPEESGTDGLNPEEHSQNQT